MGGLGVGNMMHKSLCGKFSESFDRVNSLWWRFSESENSLWKKLLKSVYDIKGLKASSESFDRVRDSTWAQLMSNDIDTSKVRSIIEEGMLTKVGNGESVRFWHDR